MRYRTLLLAPAFSLLLFSAALNAGNLNVVFRFDDPSQQYAHVFLPGSFNNWANNSGGVIAVNSPTAMTYDAAHGCWTETVALTVGSTYQYKIYVTTDQAGNDYTWMPDPANTITDGSADDNSQVTIQNLMIFEATEVNSGGNVTGVNAQLLDTAAISSCALVVNGDTIDETSSYVSADRAMLATLGSPQSPGASISIIMTDAHGNTSALDFYHAPAAPAYTVPDWAMSAVWYQIFPERFRNDDPTDDPIKASLVTPQYTPSNWAVMPWTKDWYARQPWEYVEGSNFYNSVQDRRYGGDLKGIIDKLGYIDSLGINAIYLNPVLYSPSLHKYDQTSYIHIDPYFGPNPSGDIAQIATETMDSSTWHWTSADTMFLGLVRDAHQLGIKVIMDGVFNHCGIYFPPFLDVQHNLQNSAFKDWFVITSYSPFQYEGWDGVQQMPVFATTPDGTNMAAGPKNHIFQITRRWMNPHGNVADGIDGWRLDTVPDVPIDFWTDWNTLVRSINPDAYTSSEVWYDASSVVSQGRFSGTMNYYFSAVPIVDFMCTGSETASSFAADVTTAVSHYGTASAFANQNLVDSHDTERMITMATNAGITTSYNSPNWAGTSNSYNVDKPSAHDREVQNLMVLAQVTIPGAPMIYNGDEMGMWGAGDPDDRMPLSWPDLNMALQATDPRGLARTPDNVNFDSTVYNYYHGMIALHRAYVSLQRGSFTSVYSNDAAKTLAFTRTYSAEKLLVVINRNETAQSVTLHTAGVIASNQSVFFTGSTQSDPSTISFSRTDTTLTVNLPAVAGVVYRFATTTTASVPLANGWNLVSVPLDSGNTGWSSLFPTASTPPFMYNGLGYAAITTLQTGVGYWVKVPALDTASIAGAEIATKTIALNAGWNIIGAISSPVSVTSLTSETPGLVVSQFYGYAHTYVAADSLYPGYGYWVRASVAGSITLNAGSVATSKTRVKIVPTGELPPAPPVTAAATKQLPKEFALSQNYPNPFNPTTLIEYALPKQAYVTLTLYNVVGQQIAKLVDGEQQPGYKSVTFNGSNLSSGLYFYRLNAGTYTSVKKMMLVK